MKIDPGISTQNPLLETHSSHKRIYKRIPHERMGGTIPVWENRPNTTPNPTESSALSFTQPTTATAPEIEEFGFNDLLDMLNPLHHIPLLGTAYRALTGDEISAPAKLIGGTVYGGPISLISNLTNTVLQQETGNDIIGLALGRDPAPRPSNRIPEKTPETTLSLAQNHTHDPDLTRTLLSFADLTTTQNPAPPKQKHQNTARYNS